MSKTASFFGAFILAMASATTFAQQAIQYPYNPDVNNDEYIATNDLTGFLAQFGQAFQPAPILVGDVDLLEVIQTMQNQILELQSQVETLQASAVEGLSDYLVINDSAQTLVVQGANLQVVNGMGTDLSQNGFGNIIVGYNTPANELELLERTGSHNLILGMGQRYTGNCNLIGGQDNLASGTWGIVLGTQNDLSGIRNVMIGGSNNHAEGAVNVVVGGASNHVDGEWCVVMGGQGNEVGGQKNAAFGGRSNSLSLTTHSTIVGGENNTIGSEAAGTSYSAVVGGVSNSILRGGNAAIFGGEVNSIGSTDDEADVRFSVITGGRYNHLVSGYANGIYGGEQNQHLVASEDGSVSEVARTTFGGFSNHNKSGFGTTVLGGQALLAVPRNNYDPSVATVDVLIGSMGRTFIGSTSSSGGELIQTEFGPGE